MSQRGTLKTLGLNAKPHQGSGGLHTCCNSWYAPRVLSEEALRSSLTRSKGRLSVVSPWIEDLLGPSHVLSLNLTCGTLAPKGQPLLFPRAHVTCVTRTDS